MANFYPCTSTADLKAIHGNDISNADIALVADSSDAIIYYLNATSGATESIPDIVAPTNSPGAKRWILVYMTAATIEVGTTTTGEPRTNASVTNSGTTHEAVFNFTIPQGMKGIDWKGEYDNVASYLPQDGVFYNDKCYICTDATTGNLPTDTDYWHELTFGPVIDSDIEFPFTKADGTSGVITLDGNALISPLTVSGTIPVYSTGGSTPTVSLKNNAVSPATITAIDTGALSTGSDTVVPTSKAVASYAGDAVSKAHSQGTDTSVGTLQTLQFDTTPTVGSYSEGKLYYDETWKTLSLNAGRDVNLQIGQEELRRVYNNTGSTISDGKAVYTSGTYNAGTNDVATIGLAVANDSAKYQCLGLTTQSIENEQYGFVTVRGHVNDVNTSAWSNGDTLYLSDVTPGELMNTLPEAGNYKVRIGRVITSATAINHGRINVRLWTAYKLGDLSNVVVPSPSIDDTLKWNGIEWVSGPPVTSSASAGISFFMDDTGVIPLLAGQNIHEVNTLSKTPVTGTSEVVDSISVTAANSPYFGEAYLYNTALGRTSIDAGVWTFNTYASVSSTGAGRVSSIKRSVYAVVLGTGTVTMTSSGTSRTCTASSGTPFAAADVGADASIAGYVQTPKGLYRITARASATECTIEVPTTYTNEVGVAYNKWKYLFQSQSPTITALTTGYALYTHSSAQSAFSINATDKFGEIVFGVSNNTTTVYFTHNGTSRYSNFETPLITLHNNLAGLNAGDYVHLTAAEKAAFGTKLPFFNESGTAKNIALTT